MTEPEITETIETPQANGENAVGGAGTAVALPREQEAGSPLRTAGQFAKDHPYIVIAGGLAAGAIAA